MTIKQKIQHVANNLNKVAHVVNKSFEKSCRARFTIEIHECTLTPTTFDGFLLC